MIWTQDEKSFTISEVAADWHELMIPQRTMRPYIARVGKRFAASRHTTAPISHTGLHHVARWLLLTFHPMEGRSWRLSWPKHMVGYQLAQGCLQMTGSKNRTIT